MKRIAKFSLSCVMVLAWLSCRPVRLRSTSRVCPEGHPVQRRGQLLRPSGSPFFPICLPPRRADVGRRWLRRFHGKFDCLPGERAGGPFTYGPISVSGVDERALVTGPLGTFTLWDGAFALTGTVNWLEVSTHGSVGSLNAHHIINVTGITYAARTLTCCNWRRHRLRC